ncbi:MAG: hypothetical protein Q7I93_04700, partial [Syntrophales bacterium]|nr:hypothetical protein [Syntrophales bacterium]
VMIKSYRDLEVWQKAMDYKTSEVGRMLNGLRSSIEKKTSPCVLRGPGVGDQGLVFLTPDP